MKKEKFFKLFLVVYLVFLLAHASLLSWTSPIVFISACVGFTIALLAHARFGLVTIVLLLIHMGLEWREYAAHGWHFSLFEIILYVIHICLDFIFLYQELTIHMKKFRTHSLIGVVVFLGIISIAYYEFPPINLAEQEIHHSHGHSHDDDSPVKPFILGGMLGCVLYHLRKKEVSINQ
jgi:hypothetical protein